MVGIIIIKSLGAVLIVAAHMVFIACSTEQFTGTVGTNITLQFPFNMNVTDSSHFAVYVGPKDKKKIAEYKKKLLPASIFVTYPKNHSVFCNLTNLTSNDSGHYWATLFVASGGPKESKSVHLIVREENRSATGPPVQDDILIPKNRGSSSSSHVITSILVVSPVVLMAVILTWLIWCLVRTKDKQEASPHQNSNPTIQETIDVSSQVPASSLVYSVLDFPKRESAVVEVQSSDTEYAAVSYLR
ncbi:uncharacterized protein LOC117825349 [Notolabrus celidotus]|uniref:uncharacterized protein LOC117825349 n=1 Tax=Notolabrus celidotus TaxID=1203425 RepID=UPI00148F67D2|nr:uncharacterized protein LOC117825349 [Notolabrus celidotus]